MNYLLIIFFLLIPFVCNAVEITADRLERFEGEKTYVATGNVVMSGENFKLTADRVKFYEERNEIEASGNIIFEDEDIKTWAEKLHVFVDKKTGTMKNALVHIKKQDIWLSAEEIERLSEIRYIAKKATFSTCEPEKDKSQPWCFTSKKVDLTIDDTFLAKATTFKVKDIPVAFSPVFWGPGGNTRKSGFLPLKIGNSNTKGFQFSPSYYLVLDSNKDVTFYADLFSKTGIGKGLEYRYIDFDTKGMWYGYQIHDRITKQNYLELRGTHLQKLEGLDLLLDINYVNKRDFYKEYGDIRSYHSSYLFKDYSKELQARYDRFLQSSFEVSLPAVGGRFYFLAQGWKDLKNQGISPPGKAELGYFVYPYRLPPIDVYLDVNFAQYYKEDGLKGQRFEINPKITNTLGDIVKLTQSLSAKAIFYNLENASPYSDETHREMLQYTAKTFMRFYKREYDFFHVIEPFLEGVFLGVNGNPPILKEAELIDNTALIRGGIYNKLGFKDISVEGRIVQTYDFRAKKDWQKLYPLLIEARASFWKISLGFDTYQNLTKKRLERFNSWISFSPESETSISFSQRYTRYDSMGITSIWALTLRDQYEPQEKEPAIKTFTIGLIKKLSEKISLNAVLNYDSKGYGLRDSYINMKYIEKCWAANLSLSRKPVLRDGRETSEYSFLVTFELKGIGAIKIL